MKTETTQHTPGPWTVAEYHNEQFGYERSIYSAEDYKIAIVETWKGEDAEAESLANAELIAQAPTLLAQRDELLEALHRLLCERYVSMPESEQEFDEHGSFTCNSPACIQARAAIAACKAGGKDGGK